MLKAYFDESGIDAGPVCVIAGFVGGVQQWKHLDDNWMATLSAVDPTLKEFHAQDFFAKDKSGVRCRRPYKDLGEEKCEWLIRSLVTAISSVKIRIVAVSVSKSDFQFFNRQERQIITGALVDNRNWKLKSSGAPTRPYFAVFTQALYTAIKCIPNNDQKILPVFDLNPHYNRWAQQYFADVKRLYKAFNRFDEIVFSVSEAVPGIQAADLMAYLYRRSIAKDPLTSEQRQILNRLARNRGLKLHINRGLMDGILTKMAVPRNLRSSFPDPIC